MSIEQVIFRSLLAVFIGGLIGTERALHGRAAGMRTHIIVCLGAALTAMTSLYAAAAFPASGDIFRISAQVVSGIGFLGAGMIILKNGNVVTGLTTAAGVWTTATIGLALGYGFYTGAAAVSVLFLIAIVFFAKLERGKRKTEVIYLEIDDMTRLNPLLKEVEQVIGVAFSYGVMPPKSGCTTHIGLNLIIDKRQNVDLDVLCRLPNVLYAVEE